MRQEHPTAPGPVAVEEVDALLRDILARPEYAPAEVPPLYRWAGAALDWLWDRIAPVLDRLFPDPDWTSPGWTRFGQVLLAIGALLGLALLTYLVYLVVRAVRRRRIAREAKPGGATAPRTAADWEAAARAAAAREDWRSAAMSLYQAVLVRLSAAGALRVERSKTPGDYRRDLRRSRRDLAPRFEAFLRGFERIAYGPGSAGPDQYARLADAAGSLGSHG